MKAAVMGYGTVGRGVCEILTEKNGSLSAKCAGREITLGRVLDIRDLSDTPVKAVWTTQFEEIVNDPEIGVVVEAMGGTHPAFEFCMRSLQAGKSVVTSNKQLVAEKGEALFAAARENNVGFRFGAAVCGGIPVIRTMFYGLAANEILSFSGILNGTTNFILTKMIKEKTSFAAALREAQEKGYAERDPAADIEGTDACRKTAILASAAFGTHIPAEEIHTEGITAITSEDVSYAAGVGSKIKLLGRAKRLENGKIYALVSPAIVPDTELISGVEGVYNALCIHGDKVGDILLYGQGAGREATASAVTADVLDCVRNPGFDETYSWKNREEGRLIPYEDMTLRLYVRGYASDVKTAVSGIRETFDGAVLLERENAPENEIAFFTGAAKERDLRENISALRCFAAASVIRVEE